MSDWRKDIEELKSSGHKHILFLCVANSARSQIAEGIAKSLASKDIKISSAGSKPSKLNPLAVKVLLEQGIDISSHYSKPIDSIDASTVDTVITLCAEEFCPVFLGKAKRVSWPLKDPVDKKLDDSEVLIAFRETREELKKRLTTLFS